MNQVETGSPVRESQVGIALGSLEQTIAHADKAAQSLCNRIEMVLTTMPPMCENESPKVKDVCVVQLAERIAKAAKSIERIAVYLEDTRKRVEL
jgi:hypothetical protein